MLLSCRTGQLARIPGNVCAGGSRAGDTQEHTCIPTTHACASPPKPGFPPTVNDIPFVLRLALLMVSC